VMMMITIIPIIVGALRTIKNGMKDNV